MSSENAQPTFVPKSKEELANTSHLDILKGFELIKQGAEAKLYTGTYEHESQSLLVIAKERFKKTYRHPDLDASLTSKRIKNEVKLLNKASTIGISVPKVYKSDVKSGVIIMEYIKESITCKEFIFEAVKAAANVNKLDESLIKLSARIGGIIAKLHLSQIIHGDLTTSNVLIKKDENDLKIFFIDFGLASVSPQLEDKAVDLYVLERALQSTHSLQADELFENIMKGYSEVYGANANQVIDRLDQVRLRGRKRTMIG